MENKKIIVSQLIVVGLFSMHDVDVTAANYNVRLCKKTLKLFVVCLVTLSCHG